MKKLSTLSLLVFVTVFFNSLLGQSCTDCRYLSPLFDSITVETIPFGRGTTTTGDTQDLFMDIYQPYGDTASNRPLVMFAFGGGFVQGSKDDWYVYEVCRHFTKAGYVCAAMDYRLGVDLGEILAGNWMKIFFRPMQDYRAAIQHMKWDFAENGNTYRIDTSLIFAGGASSGGITALMMQYCDRPAEIAEMGDTNQLAPLGGFYSTSGFHQNYSWDCAATVNVAGALINANWIEPGDDPVISAHGDADMIVPYKYPAGGGGTLGGLFDLQGSYVVDSIARSKGVCSYLYTMEGRDHPAESMGLEYFYSVVYRIMLQLEGVRNHRSFCCPLSVDITPDDTLFYGANAPASVLTAAIANDNGNASLHWCTMPCQFSSTANSVTVTPDTTLKYVAVIATEGNCSASNLHIVYDSTLRVSSIKHLDKEIDFAVFPQPAASSITISAELIQEENIWVEVFDMKGQKVLARDYSSDNGRLNAVVDVSKLADGNYFVALSSPIGRVGMKKISVVR